MSSVKNRYFIAIIPPTPIYDACEELKKYFYQEYKSKGSLNSPPHITLHMPFEWRDDRETGLIEKLTVFALSQKNERIVVNDFGCFEPRVIFVNVAASKYLSDLQRELRQFCRQQLGLLNADYKDLPFRPHITVAFRDLKKPDFYTAWEKFKNQNFEGTFDATNICLLKHNGEKWNVLKRIKLGSI